MSVMHVYGSDTRSVILIEEHKLRAFEETVPRNILGPESNRVRGTAEGCRLWSCY